MQTNPATGSGSKAPKCLDIEGGPAPYGQWKKALLWDCEFNSYGNSDQYWFFNSTCSFCKPGWNGFFLQNQYNSMCLDVMGQAPDRGGAIGQSGCEYTAQDGRTDNLWAWDSNRLLNIQNSNSFSISNAKNAGNNFAVDASKYCMDIWGAPGTSNGANANLYVCESTGATSDHQWEWYCPAGQVIADGCKRCTGTTRRRRADSCTDCPAGTWTNNRALARANLTDDCTKCTFGSTRRRRAESCTTCGPGTYFKSNSDDCQNCTGSTRRRVIGQSMNCTSCPQGWFQEGGLDECSLSTVKMETNILPEKIKWEIQTIRGAVICKGGPYKKWYDSFEEKCTLRVNENYTLFCGDSYGEGWAGGSITIWSGKFCADYDWGKGSKKSTNFTLLR